MTEDNNSEPLREDGLPGGEMMIRRHLKNEEFKHRSTVPIAIGMELHRESKTGIQYSVQPGYSVSLC